MFFSLLLCSQVKLSGISKLEQREKPAARYDHPPGPSSELPSEQMAAVSLNTSKTDMALYELLAASDRALGAGRKAKAVDQNGHESIYYETVLEDYEPLTRQAESVPKDVYEQMMCLHAKSPPLYEISDSEHLGLQSYELLSVKTLEPRQNYATPQRMRPQ